MISNYFELLGLLSRTQAAHSLARTHQLTPHERHLKEINNALQSGHTAIEPANKTTSPSTNKRWKQKSTTVVSNAGNHVCCTCLDVFGRVLVATWHPSETLPRPSEIYSLSILWEFNKARMLMVLISSIC